MAVINTHHDIRSKNLELLADFSKYCADHPQERFWQALRNWAGASFILFVETRRGYHARSIITIENHDSFYWKGKNG